MAEKKKTRTKLSEKQKNTKNELINSHRNAGVQNIGNPLSRLRFAENGKN